MIGWHSRRERELTWSPSHGESQPAAVDPWAVVADDLAASPNSFSAGFLIAGDLDDASVDNTWADGSSADFSWSRR